MLIRISNIDRSTSLDDIWNLFAEFGDVEEAEKNDMPDPGKFTFTGYVVMTYAAEADEAIEELNGERIDGQLLSVKEVEAKDVIDTPKTDLVEEIEEVLVDIPDEEEVVIPPLKGELRRKEVKSGGYRAD
ncbi:MAG: RNA recognition motif domain-containing protein [Bacteroidia bacterium]